MHFRSTAAIAAMGLLLAGMVAAASPAGAAPACQSVIIHDDAHMFTGHLVTVTQAACKLADEGAKVQLVTLNGTGDGVTLDSYLTTHYAKAFADPMTILLAMTRDGQSQIFPGTHWRTALGPLGGQRAGWRQFLAHRGDYVGDFIAGMTATNQALLAYYHPTGGSDFGAWLALIVLAAVLLFLVAQAVRHRQRPNPQPSGGIGLQAA